MNIRPDRIRARKAPPAPLPAAVWHADGSLTLALPYPPTAISPNSRRGESRGAAIRKSRTIKIHRLLAKLRTREAVAGRDVVAVFAGYSLAHYFPTAAFRDDDNADGACKAYRDGIAEALGVDDRSLKKLRLSTAAKDAGCPRVEITLYPAP